jgi:hypothetical protein
MDRQVLCRIGRSLPRTHRLPVRTQHQYPHQQQHRHTYQCTLEGLLSGGSHQVVPRFGRGRVGLGRSTNRYCPLSTAERQGEGERQDQDVRNPNESPYAVVQSSNLTPHVRLLGYVNLHLNNFRVVNLLNNNDILNNKLTQGTEDFPPTQRYAILVPRRSLR